MDNDAAREYGEGETMQEAWRKHFTEAKHKDGVGGSAGKSIAHCTHLSLIAFSSLSVADSATDRALWEPFDSEMDCDVASWCIKEGVSEGAVNRLLNTSGKTYLPCQVALCQNTLDKVLMTYGGKNMLGKRLNCHSVHVMVDDYYTRHVNIDQPKKWHFWPKEPSAWSLFPAFHTGFGA